MAFVNLEPGEFTQQAGELLVKIERVGAMMTHSKFEQLIHDLEGYARREPDAYRLRVGLLAGLGYGYLLLILAILIGLLTAMILATIAGHLNGLTVRLGIVAAIIVFTILRSLYVVIPAPEGLKVTEETEPKLFAMLNGISDQLHAPRFHHVLLTDDFNAAVAQVPRLGIFGWHTNYLMLGLPMMHALSPEQFRAVVAHELGHLSANHSRFSGWIYRQRQTWAQLEDNLAEHNGKGAFIFRGFLRWYAPFFNAYTFVLARTDEYVADQCAAEVVGSKVCAEALVNVTLKSHFLDGKFWPELFEGAKSTPEPPPAPYARMLSALPEGAQKIDADKWFFQALGERTDFADTHPSLTQRLSALGFHGTSGGPLDLPKTPIPTPAPIQQTAAAAYFGPLASRYIAQFEQEWRGKVARGWQKFHEDARKARQRLDFLDRQSQSEPLSREEAWERIECVELLYGIGDAIPLLQEIAAADPKDVRAQFTLGRAFLAKEDAQGIAFLERAIILEPQATLAACEELYAYAGRRGDLGAANEYRRRALIYRDQRIKAEEERASVVAQDSFVTHGLEQSEIQRIWVQIAGFSRIHEAYLVRKVVKNFPEEPLYVLAIQPVHAFLESDTQTHDAILIHELSKKLTMPGETALILMIGPNKAIGRKIRQITTARIYRRD